MKRLFAFGDSYSQYMWPMWPAIIGQNFDTTINYGHSGSGNFHIFFRVLQALIEKKIEKNDVVIVQWSIPTRFDYIDGDSGTWSCRGDNSALNFRQNNMSEFNSDQLCILKQLAYMESLAGLLTASGCQWYFIFLSEFSMVHSSNHAEKFSIKWHINSLVYREYMAFVTSLKRYHDRFMETCFYEYIESNFGSTPWKYKCSYMYKGEHIEFVDSHPSPRQTLAWILDSGFMNSLNLDKEIMRKYADHAENALDAACFDNMKYDPSALTQAFANFEDQFNYKNITKTYHV